MYLGCEFGELAIILHGGLIYCDYFETFPEYSDTHKIGFAYCLDLLYKSMARSWSFYIGHTGVPSVPAWNFFYLAMTITIVVGYF